MAFLKKPLKWTALGQEPSELKKSEGFKMDESPAPGHFDFMFRSTYEAIEELQQKAGEVKTVNNVQPDGNGNVLIPLPDTSKLYQKPTSGIPKTDLDATVQASLKKADDAAPLTELAKTNQALTTHQADNVSHDTYVSCTTASATAEKVVTSVGFTLVEGARITVKFANANTVTVPTLKINTEVAKPLVKADGTAFKNIKSGIYSFVYSGTSFTVQGEGGEYGTAIAGDVLSGKTIGTDTGLVTGTMPNRGVFNLALGASVPAGYYSGGTVPNGKRWASGTLKSSSGSNGYFLDTNGNPTTSPYITFPGLAFIPSKIILKHNSFGVTTWSYDDLYYTSSSSRANAVANDNWYRVPYTTPMNIPVTGTGADYEWIAYE